MASVLLLLRPIFLPLLAVCLQLRPRRILAVSRLATLLPAPLAAPSALAPVPVAHGPKPSPRRLLLVQVPPNRRPWLAQVVPIPLRDRLASLRLKVASLPLLVLNRLVSAVFSVVAST